jgi:hypothetical protein
VSAPGVHEGVGCGKVEAELGVARVGDGGSAELGGVLGNPLLRELVAARQVPGVGEGRALGNRRVILAAQLDGQRARQGGDVVGM